MKNQVKNTKKVNKVLTQAQKEERKLKALKNKQFTHVQSAKLRNEIEQRKNDFKSMLLEVKRVAKLEQNEFKDLENMDYQNRCIKLVNYIAKSDELIAKCSEVVTRNKKGNFQRNYTENLIQAIYKLENKKGLNVPEALQYIHDKKVSK